MTDGQKTYTRLEVVDSTIATEVRSETNKNRRTETHAQVWTENISFQSKRKGYTITRWGQTVDRIHTCT